MDVRRKPGPIEAWRIPAFGKASDEPLPDWIKSRLEAGELMINGLGGLTHSAQGRTQWSVAGDWVVLNESNQIEFVDKDDFEHRFEVIEPLPQAA